MTTNTRTLKDVLKASKPLVLRYAPVVAGTAIGLIVGTGMLVKETSEVTERHMEAVLGDDGEPVEIVIDEVITEVKSED